MHTISAAGLGGAADGVRQSGLVPLRLDPAYCITQQRPESHPFILPELSPSAIHVSRDVWFPEGASWGRHYSIWTSYVAQSFPDYNRVRILRYGDESTLPYRSIEYVCTRGIPWPSTTKLI